MPFVTLSTLLTPFVLLTLHFKIEKIRLALSFFNGNRMKRNGELKLELCAERIKLNSERLASLP